MTTPKAFAAIAIACLWAAGPANAASDKLVSGLGHDLAEHNCSRCHMIEAGQNNPPDHVGGPTFQSVADRPGTTPESLRRHLTTTHTNAMIPLAMPNPQLTEDELIKIVSYLMSLKAPS